MNKETVSLLRLIGVTAVILLLTFLSIDSTSSGFHVHDSHFVMNAVTKIILFLVFSAFTGSLFASVFSRFRNKIYVRAFIFSTLLLFSMGIYIFSLFVKPS